MVGETLVAFMTGVMVGAWYMDYKHSQKKQLEQIKRDLERLRRDEEVERKQEEQRQLDEEFRRFEEAEEQRERDEGWTEVIDRDAEIAAIKERKAEAKKKRRLRIEEKCRRIRAGTDWPK